MNGKRMNEQKIMTNSSNKYGIVLTDSAWRHFIELLAQEDPTTALRVWVDNGGTAQAKVNIEFCESDGQAAMDELIEFGTLKLFLAEGTGELLREAYIDFQETAEQGKLAIHAPFIKGCVPSEKEPLKKRIEYILESEINPMLAMHKGEVQLVELEDDGIAVVRLIGGCQGCGMAQMTLKQGIERRLKELFPEIQAVKDMTEHALGTNPYC